MKSDCISAMRKKSYNRSGLRKESGNTKIWKLSLFFYKALTGYFGPSAKKH